MGRILALDYGTKRTGIAVSDPMRIIAGALDTVPTSSLIDFLKKYIDKNDVDIIVVGKPLQTYGTPSQTMPGVENMVGRLKKEFPGIDITFYDERYTSVLAQKALIEGGVKKSGRRDKSLVDRVSAAIILRDYMESMKIKSENN